MLKTHFPINRFGSLDTYINNYQSAYAGGIKIPGELYIVYLRLNLKMVIDYWLLVLSPTHEKETAFSNSLQDHHRNKREKNDESKKKANPIATQQTPYPSIKKPS
jgi:hypothetical protein